MTGTALLGLVLLSMAWLLFALALYLRVGALAAVAGSLAAFFTIPALAGYGIEVPWPWLWILLPLVLVLQKR
jgi:hypothetical protein